MVIYLSGNTNKELSKEFIDRGYHKLFSQYKSHKKIREYIEMGGSHIMLDSGAFSAFNSGATIDIDEYIEFANSITEHCDIIVNLDVIGDGESSYKNFLYMRDRLKESQKLMPVFHQSEPMKYLNRYLDSGCKLLGLGGMVKKANGLQQKFLDSCGSIIQQYSDVWVHLFGVSNVSLLQQYDFVTSCDSTTWCIASAYHYITYPKTCKRFYVGQGRVRKDIAQKNKNWITGMSEKPPKYDPEKDELDPDVQSVMDELGIQWNDLIESSYQRSRFSAYVMNDWSRTYVKPKKYSRGLF